MNILRRLFSSSQTATTGFQRQRIDYSDRDFAAIYAIGDVHGCLAELLAAERRILRDARGIAGPKLIVMLGDYIDRGRQSRQVLEHLLEAPPEGFERVLLCGNHEDLFLDFMEDVRANIKWLQIGGVETLFSYGIDAAHLLERSNGQQLLAAAVHETVPLRHVELLRSLTGALTVGKVIFVHAGIRPGIDMRDQDDHDLLWIREPFLRDGPQLPYLVVHGHTPAAEPVFGNGRIGIDTAAYQTGKLTVLRVANGKADIIF